MRRTNKNENAANWNKNGFDQKSSTKTTGSRKIRTCLTALGLLTLVSMSACARHEAAAGAEISTRAETTANEISAHEPTANETEQMASMPNPFTDHTSLADAQTAAGFSIKVPEAVQGVSANVFRTLGNEMIEVIYLRDYDAKNGQEDATADNSTSETSCTEIARIRKGLYDKNSDTDSADISGDYNTYSETSTSKIGTREVTMKGDNGMVKTAIWTDGGYAYSISTDGISVDEISALIADIE
ncbi:hypothetical protein [Brotaphodocola sp.]|uniref:hypothetical protein n=1 Tax=Brotaphodocola sp. TaxID=3073577 RepID=UPI003D7E91D6